MKKNISFIVALFLTCSIGYAQPKGESVLNHYSKIYREFVSNANIVDYQSSLVSFAIETDTTIKYYEKLSTMSFPKTNGDFYILGDPINGVGIGVSGYYNISRNISFTANVGSYMNTNTVNTINSNFETGVGINFDLFWIINRNSIHSLNPTSPSPFYAMSIHPSIGFGHGNKVSGNKFFTAFESIIPSLSLFLKTKFGEVDAGASYYTSINKQATSISANYMWYWVYSGFSVISFCTVGAFIDENIYFLAPTKSTGGTGGWIRFNYDCLYIRFAAGINIREEGNPVYFKATASIGI